MGVVKLKFRPFYPRKEPLYPLNKRLGGSRNQSGRPGEKKFASTGIQIPNVQA